MYMYVCMYMYVYGLPGSSVGKESAYNAGDTGDMSLSSGSERSPGGGSGSPLCYSCLEYSCLSVDRGACLAGYSP